MTTMALSIPGIPISVLKGREKSFVALSSLLPYE